MPSPELFFDTMFAPQRVAALKASIVLEVFTIIEFVPNDDRVTPPLAAAFSRTMLSGTPAGDAYTLRELRAMLTEGGFTDVSAHPLPALQTIIVASR
jgi:hypothetical protein